MVIRAQEKSTRAHCGCALPGEIKKKRSVDSHSPGQRMQEVFAKAGLDLQKPQVLSPAVWCVPRRFDASVDGIDARSALAPDHFIHFVRMGWRISQNERDPRAL